MQRNYNRAAPNLSIVVPWMENDRLFEDTLASVLRNQPENSEVLVPHGPGFVDHHRLANEVLFCESPGTVGKRPRSLNELFNVALQRARGPAVNLIRPGVEVDEGWSCRPLEILTGNSEIASVSPPILNACKPKQLLACGVSHTGRMRRLLVGGRTSAKWKQLNRTVIGPSSWCAFYSREALNQIRNDQDAVGDGQLSDSVLDLDIALSLKSIGYQHQVVADYSVSSEIDLVAEDEPLRGIDANRLATRHSGVVRKQSAATRVFYGAIEVASGLVSPSRARFALSRVLAGRHRREDLRFADLLQSRLAAIKQDAQVNEEIRRAA